MKDNRSRYGPTHYVVDGRTMTPETAEQHVAWLLYRGETQTGIATAMGWSISTVYLWAKRPGVLKWLKQYKEHGNGARDNTTGDA